MIKSSVERNAFINKLDLGPTPKSIQALSAKPAVLADNKESASVDAGSVISFTANITGQAKSDVLNSTLLAQLAANKQHDRVKDAVNWYKFYFDVLNNVGWNTQNYNFLQYNAGGSTFIIDQAIISLLAAIATQEEAAMAEKALTALKNLSNSDNRFVIWDVSTHGTGNGNFQLGTAAQSGSSVTMSSGGVYFSASQVDARFLWSTYSSTNASVFHNTSKYTLDEDVYKQVRDGIVQKLGDRAKQFVADLEI